MLNLLKERRSIRKFKNVKIEREKIEQIIQAALLSPTSKNSRPWEFIIIDDEEKLVELSKCRPYGAAFVKDAPLAIVVLADPEKSGVWIEDATIASTIVQLTAQSIGLGSCWVQIREREHDDKITAEDYVKSLLNIPNENKIEAIIVIGYPDEQKSTYKDEDLKLEKVYINEYGKMYFK